MKNASLYLIAAMAGIVVAGQQVASANLIQNGDFSANGTAYTSFPGYDGGSNPSDPTGWFNLTGGPWGPYHGVNQVLAAYAFNPSPFAPSDGGGPSLPAGTRYFGFIQSAGSTLGTVGQNFAAALTPNTTYTLSFYAASRTGDSSNLDIVINDGSVTAPDTYGGNNVYDTRPGSASQGSSTTLSPPNSGFKFYTVTFKSSSDAGTSGDGSLIFLNQNGSGDQTTDITNVVLTPEPASLGLLGLSVVGLLARRRRA